MDSWTRDVFSSRAMDWKLFGSTFLAIFLAELGDKTQLATLALASSAGSRWVIFAGAALALVATSALGVLGGGFMAKIVPLIWIHRAAGAMFIGLGIYYLWESR